MPKWNPSFGTWFLGQSPRFGKKRNGVIFLHTKCFLKGLFSPSDMVSWGVNGLMYITQFATFKKLSPYNCGRFPWCHLPPQTMVQVNKQILLIFVKFTLSKKTFQRPSLASAGSSLPWRVSIAMHWALIFSPRLWGISIVVDGVSCRGDDVECARNMPPAVLMPMCPWSNERSVRTRCLCHIRKFFRKGGMGGEKGEKMGVFFSGGEDLEVFMCAMVWCHIDVTSRWRHWPIRSGDLEKPLWGIPKKGRTVQVLLVSLVGIFFGGHIHCKMCIYIYKHKSYSSRNRSKVYQV